jgi:hypothetical protein
LVICHADALILKEILLVQRGFKEKSMSISLRPFFVLVLLLAASGALWADDDAARREASRAELNKLVDLEFVRHRGLRSFARLELAVRQLADACRTGKHVATPPSPGNSY